MSNDRPEKQIKALEAVVSSLIEESIAAQAKEELRLALDKAKEAASKERSLHRQREQAAIMESNNDLTFLVSELFWIRSSTWSFVV